jgi:hypothetical protein
MGEMLRGGLDSGGWRFFEQRKKAEKTPNVDFSGMPFADEN